MPNACHTVSANWTDSEIRALLSIRSEADVIQQISGTVRDAVVYDKITDTLRGRGWVRRKAQVISKLKSLRKKYQTVNEHHGGGTGSGSARLQWPYFDICESIWGSSASPAGAVTVSSATEESEENTTTETMDDGGAGLGAGDKTMDGDDDDDDETSGDRTTYTTPKEEEVEVGLEEPATESCPTESLHPPPRKKAKKTSRLQQMSEDMQKLFAEMDREYYRREHLRLQEQRDYEERLRKKAMEREESERTWQMAMFREMQETQVKLFREVLGVLRQPAPRHPFYPPDRQRHGPDLHYNSFNASPFHESIWGGSPATHGISEGRSSYAYEMMKSVSDLTRLLHMGHNAERATQTESERHHQKSKTENETVAEERPQHVAEERIKQETEERPQPLSEEKIKQEIEDNIKQVVI